MSGFVYYRTALYSDHLFFFKTFYKCSYYQKNVELSLSARINESVEFKKIIFRVFCIIFQLKFRGIIKYIK